MRQDPEFDVLVIGGGLAGSSLAIALAREGARVLLVERERVFRDRVRGEVMAPWGTVEARRLRLLDLLRERCAIDVRYLTYHFGGEGESLDLPTAAPHFEPSLAFHHPVMQETLIDADQHDEYWVRLRDAERLSAAALMSVGPGGASRRDRALEIFGREPELETWTYGPEANCDDAVRAELLA